MSDFKIAQGNGHLHRHEARLGASALKQIFVLLTGIYFGVVLVKSEVMSWFRIQKMFLFEEAHMYLIIASAVVVGAITVWLIKRFQLRTITGEQAVLKAKPFNKGIVFGGTLFGMGWAITGACPGPIYAQIGAGEYMALVTLISAVGGMYLYAWLRPKLPH